MLVYVDLPIKSAMLETQLRLIEAELNPRLATKFGPVVPNLNTGRGRTWQSANIFNLG
jgi:hypothetical protein